ERPFAKPAWIPRTVAGIISDNCPIVHDPVRGGSMLEVEMKFPDADFARLRRQLRLWGARRSRPVREEDHYFNAPDRDLAATDEALRLRRAGRDNVLTYKGPKLGRTTKTRTEIEAALAKGDEAAANLLGILTHLKYRPVAVVKKVRTMYTLDRGGFPM